MAGDWIPMRVNLPDDPAVIAIAAATGLDVYAVVGRLLKLWGWANEHLVDGRSKDITATWIDHYVALPGFAAAMLNAGWLRSRSGAGVEFPSFDRWNSSSAKKRVLTAERVRKHRNAPNVTESLPEKRREEKTGEAKPSPVAGASPAKEKKTRPRDELFDAVAEITGSDPGTSGSHVAKIAAALRRGEPPFTPDEVREFGKRFPELCTWSDGRRPTLGEVEKYIGLLRAGQGASTKKHPPRNGFQTHDQRVADEIGGALSD